MKNPDVEQKVEESLKLILETLRKGSLQAEEESEQKQMDAIEGILTRVLQNTGLE